MVTTCTVVHKHIECKLYNHCNTKHARHGEYIIAHTFMPGVASPQCPHFEMQDGGGSARLCI